jgi:hypothetical protein
MFDGPFELLTARLWRPFIAQTKLQLGLQLPVRDAGSCSNVVKELRSRIQWLTADLEEFACAATYRGGSALVPFSRPIRGNDRSREYVRPVLEVLKGEPVDVQLILMHVVDSCVFTAN